MGSVSNRMREELRIANRQITDLRAQVAHLEREVNLAYQEGFDQGRAEAEAMEAAS